MKELHVSTEIKGTTALQIITKIVAELWNQKEETCQRVMSFTEESALTDTGDFHEKIHAEGIMAGLDLAMDIIVGTVIPDYFAHAVDDI